MPASRGSMRRVTRKPKVTAGLKWPPEMWPRAEAITPIASPCASATPTRSAPTAIEPMPAKTSANAPTNSAAARRPTLSSTGAKLSPRPDGTCLLAWACGHQAPPPRADLPPLPQAVHGRGARLGRAARLQVPALQAVRARGPRRGAGEDLEGVLEALRLGQGLELLQRVVLDLTDPLARDAEGAADLLERPRRVAVQPVAHLDHLPLARGEGGERVLDVPPSQRQRGGVERGFGLLVGDEIA